MRRDRRPFDLGSVVLWIVPAIMLVAGVAIVPKGFPTAGSDGPVMCGDEVMGPGDSCRLEVSGSISINTYEELHAKQLAGHGWEPEAFGIGGAFLLIGLLGVAGVVYAYRRGRSGDGSR
ncbi:hypothetical protein [Kutzneria sp. NPDC052558]|uniref:hypothetical protein n=1 Tax=Kutzneria sp. NPDC052558 TaxID=3364121 RepID=UPI0037C87C84